MVELIDSQDQFDALREPWQALFSKDADAGFFLSWGWISALFRQYPERVRLLAVRQRDNGEYIGFFPISTRIRWSRSYQKFQTVLEPGGRSGLSELTGFLCDPEHERQAIAALVCHICTLPWTRFSVRYEPTGRRSQMVLEALPKSGFRGRFKSYLINDDTVDNLICPQIPLPGSHDDWLALLSANTRQKIRRFSRRHLDTGDWQISQTTADTVERDIDVLMDLWTRRWGAEKSRSQSKQILEIYRHMMMTAQRLGALQIPILWQKDRPLVAHGCIADRGQNRIHFVLSGREVDDAHQNGGLLLHSETIREAIKQGWGTYDLGHGDEAYKASLGAQNTQLHYISVDRLSDDPRDAIDPFNTSQAVRRIQSLLDAERTASAQKACQALANILEAHQLRSGPTPDLLKEIEAKSHD